MEAGMRWELGQPAISKFEIMRAKRELKQLQPIVTLAET
jgi:hypothetical protein